MRLILLFKNAFLKLCVFILVNVMCVNSLCLLTETAFSSYNIRTRFARHTIVKLRIESQFDFKLAVKRKNNIYVEENTNCAFLLELLVSQIRFVATRSDPNRSIETCVQQYHQIDSTHKYNVICFIT